MGANTDARQVSEALCASIVGLLISISAALSRQSILLRNVSYQLEVLKLHHLDLSLSKIYFHYAIPIVTCSNSK